MVLVSDSLCGSAERQYVQSAIHTTHLPHELSGIQQSPLKNSTVYWDANNGQFAGNKTDFLFMRYFIYLLLHETVSQPEED